MTSKVSEFLLPLVVAASLRPIKRFLPLYLLVFLFLLPFPGVAASPVTLGFSVQDIVHPEYSVSAIKAELTAKQGEMALILRIGEVVLSDGRRFQNVQLECNEAETDWPRVHCPIGNLSMDASPWGHQRVKASLDWQSADDWHLTFKQLRYAGGRVDGELRMRSGQWVAKLKGKGVQLAQSPDLQQVLEEKPVAKLQGQLTVHADLRGAGAQPRRALITGKLAGLNYETTDGLHIGEAVQLDYRLQLNHANDWHMLLDLAVPKGQIYSDPVFLDAAEFPLSLHLDGKIDVNAQKAALKRFDFRAQGLAQALGYGTVDITQGDIRSGELRLDSENLEPLYLHIAQPFLIGSRLDDLVVSGRGGLHLKWQDQRLARADLAVDQLTFDHAQGMFGLRDLSANMHWASGKAPLSYLSLSGGHLGKLHFGPAQLNARIQAGQAQVIQDLYLPFYGGGVILKDFHMDFQDDLRVSLGISVQRVDLQAMTTALQWPPMSGEVNGDIPKILYQQGEARIEGGLTVNAFDGTLRIGHLSLSEIDSVAPVLDASLELEGLDLAKVTETFSFGSIRGGLAGRVDNLQLIAWQPNRFDAHFHSPEDDPLPHRISQGAVEHLTELGNGVSGALSSSFLRFFEAFSYDSLDIRLSQQGDRAWIDGINHPEGGFYLVKGAGVPRIDVIGRNHEVAWKDLVGRIQAIRFDNVQLQ